MKPTRVVVKIMEHWAHKEETILRNNVHATRLELIQLFPDRTWPSIYQRAKRMGLNHSNDNLWIEGELKILQENYPFKLTKEVMKLLPNRSKTAIITKAHKLRLSKVIPFWLQPSKIKTFSEVERGYIAGIIDGEGTVSLRKERNNRLCLRVSVGNTNLEMLKKVRDFIGTGCICRKDRQPRWKECWDLQISAVYDIRDLLEQIRDIVIVKKEQTLLALKFIDLYLKRKYYTENTPEMYSLYFIIKELNHRGK